MWLLVIFLSLIGTIHFLMSVSLLEKKRFIALTIIAISLIPIGHHYFALQTNFKVITNQLSNLEFVSGLVALEIAVIILTTFFSLDTIHSHFNNSNGKIMKMHPFGKKFFSLFPSVFFIVGIILLQLWVFNEISGASYIWLSVGLSIAIFISLSVFVFLFKAGLKDWTLRLEIKSLLSLLLIMGATLLPIFFQQISIVTLNKSQIDFNESLLILSLTLIIMVLGFFNYKFRMIENIWKRFIKF